MDPIALPLHTERLVVRPMRPEDAATLHAYRSHPDVARYQFWPVPYPLAHADEIVASVAGIGALTAGTAAQLSIDHDGAMVGDLFVDIDGDGETAAIGYTLAPTAQGKGLAIEATATLVDALFAHGLHRITADVDPGNEASSRLLEHLGFRYEGRAVQATLVRGAWVDDDRYAILADERRAWVQRPRTPPAEVRLAELDHRLAVRVGGLRTHRWQERFVSPMAASFRDAVVPEPYDPGFPDHLTGRLVPPSPWLRAVLADGEVVAFVMLAWPTEPEEEPYLWRLLVDRWHQQRGIGTATVRLVVDEVRAAGCRTLLVSYGTGRGSPQPFYDRLGFVPTGHVEDGELVARLTL